ncbi:DUF1145 domain-containing protein [Pseudomonas sp. HK3]|jgi:uncharacterized protein YhhL (DUF1145 family)
MKRFNQLNKVALYVFWVAFIVNLIMPFGGDWGQGILYVGLGLLVVHLLEYILVFKKLKRIERTTAKDFVGVMLVGLFHWLPLLKKAP